MHTSCATLFAMTSVHIIYASTSGHTEFVVDHVMEVVLQSLPKDHHDVEIEKQRAELATADDMLRGDVLILATSSWNTGGPEGQMNPHMHGLLRDRAAGLDLQKKNVAVIGLGDDRYHFLCRAADLMIEYIETHNGTLIRPELRIVNEPYGQEKTVEEWTQQFLKAIS